VAKCEKLDLDVDMRGNGWAVFVDFSDDYCRVQYEPSSKWGWGGPIIEREELTLSCHWQRPYAVKVLADEKRVVQGNGPTPLIAAMRCYVAAHLGDEVEVPEELK
jgi:hypothetical protein